MLIKNVFLKPKREGRKNKRERKKEGERKLKGKERQEENFVIFLELYV